MKDIIDALKAAAVFIPNPLAATAVSAAASLIGAILDQHDAWEAAEEHRQLLAARAAADAEAAAKFPDTQP